MRASVLSLLAGLALLVSACGNSTPTPGATTTQAAPPTVLATATIAANAGLTPAPMPAGWQYVSWSNPDLQVALPGDWTKGDPTQTTDPASMSSASPAMRKAIEWSNEMASSGKTRLMSFGKVETPLGSVESGSVFVYVESGDPSLAAFADRQVKLDGDLGGQSIDRSDIVLPAGNATRLAYSGQLGDATTRYCEVDYLFLLPDGRSLTVSVAGNAAAAVPSTVSVFAARVIATLRPTT